MQLQQTLIRELHYGILSDPDPLAMYVPSSTSGGSNQHGAPLYVEPKSVYERALPLEDPVAASCMPEAWARAAILIRINSLISGHSGVRQVVIERMAELLAHAITPRIPLRGSISASGDLSPLSYLGGVLQGKATLTVWADDSSTGIRRVTTARQALEERSLEPIHLEAKEGLAIVNGTAVSCAAGALCLQEAQNLATLSQVLTAMSVEALQGNIESFNPFFGAVRPHPGQVESAYNVEHFLSGSRLITVNDGSEEGVLRQDRYSIRTASQWLGPSLEDLFLAHRQITTECNSVTDNPLIDDKGNMLHGGNFQAKAVTSAMEKTRLALQTIGQMLYAQCTELINPATNRGLAPNLVADEPGESFIFKAVDLMTAALQSELGFLSNPVGTYVQPAEMGNQALNSLALISARYTHTAVNVLSQLAASHLMALCQALDLRAMHARFLDDFRGIFQAAFLNSFHGSMNETDLADLEEKVWKELVRSLGQNLMLDSGKRIRAAVNTLQAELLSSIPAERLDISSLKSWIETCISFASMSHASNRECYIANPDATPFLGRAAKRMYNFVRHELEIPFLVTKMLLGMEIRSASLHDSSLHNGKAIENAEETKSGINGHTQPSPLSTKQKSDDTEGGQFHKRLRSGSHGGSTMRDGTLGSFIGRIHHAIRNGRLFVPVMACLQDSLEGASGMGSATKNMSS